MTDRPATTMMCPVSRNLGTMDAPPATRVTTPGWRDPRLWIGVALVATSVVAGARILAGADDAVEVWAAAGDLAAGQPLTETDLVVRRVRFGEEADVGRYLTVADGLPDDATLARAIGVGELLPMSAFEADDVAQLEVPIWAPAVAVPDGIGPGTVVDVWVTPAADGRRRAALPVLDDVVVLATPGGEGAFGPSGDQQVLVGVDPAAADGVGLALAAAKDGRVAFTVEG